MKDFQFFQFFCGRTDITPAENASVPPNSLVHLDVDNSVAFSYLTKHGGKIGKLNAILRPFLVVEEPQTSHFSASPSSVQRYVGGRDLPVGLQPRGILPQSTGVCHPDGSFLSLLHAGHRHVRVAEQCAPTSLLRALAPSPSASSRYIVHRFDISHPRVRTPTVVHYRQVLASSLGAPKSKVPRSPSLMGFQVMVAPVNSPARPIHSTGENTTEVRPLRECLGDTYEKTSLAPALHSVIRECLYSRGLSEVQVAEHLKTVSCSSCYQAAFSVLYAMGLRDELTMQSSPDLFAGSLLELNGYSASTASNAYAALLLIPGFQTLKFHPLLAPVRNLWNKSVPKYAVFWDPMPVFCAFLNTSYDINVIKEVHIKIHSSLAIFGPVSFI